MNRSRQLQIEAAIIASLLLVIVIGGGFSTRSLPVYWNNIINPETLAQQPFNSTSFALIYSTIILEIVQTQYSNASFYIKTLPLVPFPQSLNSSVTNSITELGLVNTTIPLASSELGISQNLLNSGEIQNASFYQSTACNTIQQTKLAWFHFENVTTPTFKQNGVPVSFYASSAKELDSLIVKLENECSALQSSIQQTILTAELGLNFTITSPQTVIYTGGHVLINGNLSSNKGGIAGENVSFYLNGTYIGDITTDGKGLFSANLTIPYVYESNVAIWAVTTYNSVVLVSNKLSFDILFNGTEIILADYSIAGSPPIPQNTSNEFASLLTTAYIQTKWF
ncbi:MAG: Ig-like domain-containing protein [Nitrososphaerales archaeon]